MIKFVTLEMLQKFKEKLSSETVVLRAVLKAGETSITLKHSAITPNSAIDIYTAHYGINPTQCSATNGSITLSFEKLSYDESIRIEVRK